MLTVAEREASERLLLLEMCMTHGKMLIPLGTCSTCGLGGKLKISSART